MLSAFRQQGRQDWCDKVGVSVVVGVEQPVLQSFQSNNSFEKSWGKGGRPGLYEGFGLFLFVRTWDSNDGVGLQKRKSPATAAGRIAGLDRGKSEISFVHWPELNRTLGATVPHRPSVCHLARVQEPSARHKRLSPWRKSF